MVDLVVESRTNQAEAGRQGNMEARRGPPTPFFCKNVIPGEFKSNNFARVDSKGLAGAFFVRVHSKGVAGSRGWKLEA